MKFNLKTLLLCLTLTSSLYAFADNNCQENDYITLRTLYLTTDGDNWTNNTGWLTAAEFEANPTMPAGTDMGTWYGITLNTDGCLATLILTNNNLVGSIPTEIGNLTHLTGLALSHTQLSGSIPVEIGNLTNLTTLHLSDNQLSGNIPPEIGNLNNLNNLILDTNQLSGSLPWEMSQLTNLSFLTLSGNQLSGTLPAWIENLVSLESLWLYSNQLTGNLPPELGNIPNLEILKIYDNQLSGCYDANLNTLCTQLDNSLNGGNANISNGNNFDATWGDFCATEAGVCTVGTDNTHQNIFKVYPVPAKDFVVFDVPNIAAADELILYGRQAFPQDKKLAVSHLNDGVYIYRIFYDNDLYSGKIVVE